MGAPKGNTNALKHGLYAKRYSLEETAGLRNMPPEDYQHEIFMMRVVVKNIFEIHTELVALVEKLLASGQPAEVEGLTKITNSLSLAMTALNTTARTYALFNGTDTALIDPLDEALDGLAIFLDDKYLREREDGLGEILISTGGEGEKT